MDISKLKTIFQRFGFFREYSALVIPLLLTIIAGLLFVPTILMQSGLKAEIEDKSIKKLGDPIDRLAKTKPPSIKQSDVEKNYQNDLARDVNTIATLDEQTGRRELLSYNIFPDTSESSVQIYTHFGERFRKGISNMMADLKARDCPTSAELGRSSTPGAFSPVTTTSTTGEMDDKKKELITDELCTDIAKSITVYINPDNIGGYSFWSNYKYQNKKDAIEDCWYWQVGYWIIEDIFKTVKKVNDDSGNVLDSPVKRIVSISFQRSQSTQAGEVMPSMITASKARPSYVKDLKGGLTIPWTARTCNNQFDVVHFRISIIISSRATGQFVQALCSGKEHTFRGFDGKAEPVTYEHNQITVLNSSFEAVNQQQEAHKLYRYGSDGVVTLDLTCEYIFNSKGYDAIKPKSVKDELRIIKKTR
jgi:hypothetical protein